MTRPSLYEYGDRDVPTFKIQTFRDLWEEALLNPGRHKPPQERIATPILLSYTSYPTTMASLVESNMRHLSDVITYGPSINAELAAKIDLERLLHRVAPHDIPFTDADMCSVMHALPRGWRPGCFLNIETAIHFPTENLGNIPCTTAYWFIDLNKSHQEFLEIAKDYAILLLPHRETTRRFVEAGLLNTYWLPPACDPSVHARSSREKQFDISPAGDPTAYSDLLELLRERGYHVNDRRCLLEDKADLLSKSKVIVSNAAQLTSEIYEAMAFGGLLLTNDIPGSGLADMFHDREHMVVYRSQEELFELLDYYLANETEREQIAHSGQSEVLENHTYPHRIMQLAQVLSRPERLFDTRPESVYFHPLCEGEELMILEAGPGFRKTHPNAVSYDILGRGEVGDAGVMEGRTSVADIKASMEDIPFQEGVFDLYISRHTLEHVPDVEKAILDGKRVLKPGGRLGIIVPDHSAMDTFEMDPTHVHGFTPKDLEELIAGAEGFEIEKNESVIKDYSFAIVARKVGPE